MTTPTKGDIWLIDLDPTKGAEIQKIRPAVIINSDSIGKLPLRIIVPISTSRFVKRVGRVSDHHLEQITLALIACLR